MTPAVRVPGIFEGVICLAGACVYAAVEPAAPPIAALACVVMVVVLRIAAVRWRLGTTPLPLLHDADHAGR